MHATPTHVPVTAMATARVLAACAIATLDGLATTVQPTRVHSTATTRPSPTHPEVGVLMASVCALGAGWVRPARQTRVPYTAVDEACVGEACASAMPAGWARAVSVTRVRITARVTESAMPRPRVSVHATRDGPDWLATRTRVRSTARAMVHAISGCADVSHRTRAMPAMSSRALTAAPSTERAALTDLAFASAGGRV